MSATPEDRLHALGLELPAPPRPVAAYIPAKRFGNLIQISGQIPMRGGKLMTTGSVPSEGSLAEAVGCARQ